jgi:hypothetical protein
MNKTIWEQHIEDEQRRDRLRAIGSAIGTGGVVFGRLTIFIIILHFAWRFW